MPAKRPSIKKLHSLIKEALKLEEDITLSAFAKKREKIFSRTKALKHDDVWNSVLFTERKSIR
ncbi:MAG: hypothetical protein HY752_06445 [Nitrospirae bacterium]|nr:hypothetical protein [Nitrospirota bacterium]